ncbi:hypothetical protein CkaCkLH20_12695 [Colletotrichum karsti]|uniref:DNA mismatch repair protein S5 domain-containing protein n=1 Tax=Colletotrichum karsti TaxID=1095194 RepID=A0A9P6HSP0_9PEZI|nr:uncharacterized protein CkaCkLH20_12695 [Colletotrichum karsti]KAF9869778.1 hypothetical protein CkaCkLH20_12695 [Colletotrichum karsti]
MAITKLPQYTVRLLRSTVDLPTPVSLIKELVENSIDAGASNIEVTVSANVIDRIQVRDNGHGINSEDFDALGRPSHTSKLRTFEELQCKGGQTLGFRGNALASTNAVSKLMITTRTAGDSVGNLLELNPKGGGIMTQKRVSSPPGTIVDASNLFSALVVRKQQVLKESAKIHGHIKDLLQSYALTRPHIRLTFKVLKNMKRSWSYAPSGGADVREAVLQVFGKELVSQLDIECILGSYDPNVATNKDEVLFANESRLLTLFEDMCRELYQGSNSQSKSVGIGRQSEAPDASYDESELVQDGHEEETRKTSRDLSSEGPQNPDEEYLGDDSQVAGQQLNSPPSDEIRNVGQLAVHAHVPDIRKHVEQEFSAVANVAECSDDTLSLHSQDIPDVEADQPHAQQSGSAAAPVHPELTQSLLRLEWEVDMARSQTATPEVNTQEVLLVPVQSNMTGYLSQQRREQTRRENPNPWSLARTAAQRRGANRDEGTHNLVGIEPVENHSAGPKASNPAHPPSAGLVRDGSSGMYGMIPKNPDLFPDQQFRRDKTFPVQRDDAFEADDVELQHMLPPHGAEQIMRHQAESGIPRNEEQSKNPRARNEFDNLSYEIERDLGIQPDRRTQTPHPSTKFGPNSFFGTPPSSSSPVNKPFRIPALFAPSEKDRGRPARAPQARVTQGGPRAGRRKSDGLVQRKLTLNATKNLGPSELRDFTTDCLDADYDAFEDGHVSVLANTFERLGGLRRRPEEIPHSDLRRPISPSMTEAYENAVARLNALRPQAEDIIQTGGGRGYPNQVIDQTEDDEQTEQRSLAIDIRQMEQRTVQASDCDFYVSSGKSEVAFNLEPAEMDNISNKLQEIVEIWALEEYGVEVELEINVAELLMGDMDVAS